MANARHDALACHTSTGRLPSHHADNGVRTTTHGGADAR